LGFNAARLQLESLSYANGSTTLLSLAYGYTQNGGNNGQITSITDSTGTPEGGRSVAYTYDALHRLKTAETTGTTSYPKWGLQWSYDRYGNRTQQSILSGCQSPMTCPTNSVSVDAATNRLTGSPYTYDENGNMLHDGLNTLGYDAESRVVRVNSTNPMYVYDGAGLRVKKCDPHCTSPTTTTVYIFSGSKVIAEYVNGAAVNSPTREYVYSGSQLIATHEGTLLKFHHQDHLSRRVTSDGTSGSQTYGEKIGDSGHFPYGESWYESGGTIKLKFTSYERDSESGNDYAVMRFYINRFGRFCSPDRLAGSIASPQSLNRYAYVANDPLNLVDPLGLCFTATTYECERDRQTAEQEEQGTYSYSNCQVVDEYDIGCTGSGLVFPVLAPPEPPNPHIEEAVRRITKDDKCRKKVEEILRNLWDAKTKAEEAAGLTINEHTRMARAEASKAKWLADRLTKADVIRSATPDPTEPTATASAEGNVITLYPRHFSRGNDRALDFIHETFHLDPPDFDDKQILFALVPGMKGRVHSQGLASTLWGPILDQACGKKKKGGN
jgi:RHS repeat-associated protein